MDNKSVVVLLNDLIETSLDSEMGFRAFAQRLKAPAFKLSIDQHAQQYAIAANELQCLVRTLGSDPDDSGSVSEAVHRQWVGFKNALSYPDDDTILFQCERGDRLAQERYRKVLAHDIPANVRLVVERQYQGVQRSQDEVKTMRSLARAS
jgi:uncharacterized protein (TIGR02284 family)